MDVVESGPRSRDRQGQGFKVPIHLTPPEGCKKKPRKSFRPSGTRPGFLTFDTQHEYTRSVRETDLWSGNHWRLSV